MKTHVGCICTIVTYEHVTRLTEETHARYPIDSIACCQSLVNP